MDISFIKSGRKMNILFLASEAAPFAKVGGLGEVMRALPTAIRELGHDVRVFLPKYATIKEEKFPMTRELSGLALHTKDKDPNGLLISNVLKHEDPESHAITYFLENQEYYEKRANVYGYKDDPVRWVLLSKGVLEFARRSDWKPDVIIASDWETGFVPNLLETEFKNDEVLSNIATVFSIHNLRNQGIFDPFFVPEMQADSGQAEIPDFFDAEILKLNGMRRGILFADIINTVSPTYAKEILTAEFGERLDSVLNERRERLFGILNGIDYEEFNPQTDESISARYSVKTISKRKQNKLALQERMGLPQDENIFLMGFVNRLDEQKGIDLLSNIAPSLFENLNFQLVMVGTGDKKYRTFFMDLKEQYPDRVAVHPFFDEVLPKQIFAGADAALMPSRFEPSGLVQMEAMRYGCIPIVRKTGGLADTVKDYIPGENIGTGFVFEKYEQYALLIAIVRAWQANRHVKDWRSLITRAMTEDFSWHKPAEEYVKLCKKAIQIHAESLKKRKSPKGILLGAGT